jgi:hypothetical protein
VEWGKVGESERKSAPKWLLLVVDTLGAGLVLSLLHPSGKKKEKKERR